MYTFIDTTEHQTERSLPSEAMAINGTYIENEIPEYTTLYATGRELMSADYDTIEVGRRTGSVARWKRYPERLLTIGYQIIASTPEQFRDAYNRLNGMLNVEGAQISFRDEEDKYFLGTPVEMSEVESGRNAVTGEIRIVCVNPFKYSFTEYVATATEGTISFNYRGTAPTYPKIEVDFYRSDVVGNNDGNCGFVGLFNDKGKVLQFGNPKEIGNNVDLHEKIEEDPQTKWTTSELIVNQDFATYSGWTVNQGAVTDTNTYSQNGSVRCQFGSKDYRLELNNKGSGSKWHGATVLKALPADSKGHVGAKDFEYTYSQLMMVDTTTAAKKSRGLFQALVLDGDKNVICGVGVFKSKDGTQGYIRFYNPHGEYKDVTIDLSRYNKYFGYNKESGGKVTQYAVRKTSITKAGSTITYDVAGVKHSITSTAFENVEAKYIQLGFYTYGSYANILRNGVYWAKFTSNSVENQLTQSEAQGNWEQIVDRDNTFSTNDILRVDTADGTIYRGASLEGDEESGDVGTLEQGLGALGNDWEDFTLEHGTNTIGVTYSEWVKEGCEPTFKIIFREAYL